jgi:2-oxoglutarate ferredoxin oxidoreductase subunit alpha
MNISRNTILSITRFEIDKNSEPRALTSGNDAIAKGAMDCGLKFFAGYPITPATKIMEIAAKELPKLGGWTLQMEDEIAAIGAVLGASFAGRRSMTATSWARPFTDERND